MDTINFWPILVAAIVSFIIGAFWYSPILFGKEWMALMKISESDMNEARTRGIWKSYLIHFIASIVSLGVLAFLISMTIAHTAADGAIVGFIAWLGFVAPAGISNLLWRRDPIKLVIIDTLQLLVSLIVSGAIIGAWK